MIKIVGKGRSPQLRHLRRTQRVNIDWLYEAFLDPATRLRYIPTKLQLADKFAKGSFTKQQWSDLMSLINIGTPTEQCKIEPTPSTPTTMMQYPIPFYS